MMDVLSFSEMSVLTRVTRRNIPEDAILHSHHHENLKSYTVIANPSVVLSTMLYYPQEQAMTYINILLMKNVKKSISYSCKLLATAERNIKFKSCMETCDPLTKCTRTKLLLISSMSGCSNKKLFHH
jgi:hypothetical protein